MAAVPLAADLVVGSLSLLWLFLASLRVHVFPFLEVCSEAMKGQSRKQLASRRGGTLSVFR